MARRRAGRRAKGVPPLRLDLANERLWRGDELIPLRPKVFALLRCLAERPGQLVTKSALRAAVWPDVVVGDGGLMVCIRQLRQALGDCPRAGRFIETLPRRGYRLVGGITVSRGEDARRPVGRPLRRAASGRVYGRGTELAYLDGWLDGSLAGRRQVVFVTGEAGVGKTALVEAFVRGVQAREGILVCRGQCIEHYGAGEAYLPFLEALGQLCRGAMAADVVALLAATAPTWLAQMPWLVTPEEQEALGRRAASATRERMLREMAEALEALTVRRPLVVVLEDLHWSDPSTRALIAWLARRREAARLLIVATYRPADASLAEPSVLTLEQELELHGLCEELPVKLLGEAAVRDYLADRLAPAVVAPEVAALLQQRTEGNPLFMVNMLDDWLSHGWLAESDSGWALTVDAGALSASVPESLRQMTGRWIDRLDAADRRLLETASVAGVEFSAAAVAAGLGDGDTRAVDDRCAAIARGAHIVRASGEETWPDATVAGRYAFVHALYRDVLYERVAPGTRATVHDRIARRQEAAYDGRAGEIAAQLAAHFERGQDFRKAVAFLREAARAAVRRCASLEAIAHLSRALSLLSTFPEGSERAHLELGVLTALGPALTTVKGYGAHEVETIYARAKALCEPFADTTELFSVLRGLVTLQQHRGELRTARQLSRQLLNLSRQSGDAVRVLQARQAAGTTSFYLGHHVAAFRDLEWCLSHSDAGDRGPRAGLGAAVVCQGHAAWALWHVGYPDQAAERSRSALALARRHEHPQSQAFALYAACSLNQSLGHVTEAREHAEALVALASQHGFAIWDIYGSVQRGWALAMEGQTDEGRALMRLHLARLRASGADLPRTYFLGLLADACVAAGRLEAGLEAIDEALGLASARGERFWEPELHRLRGELCARDGRLAPGDGRAEAYFAHALDVARRLGSRALELRAAVSLGALWSRSGKRRAAHRLLAERYRWFSEGFGTPDLTTARAAIARLEPGPPELLGR